MLFHCFASLFAQQEEKYVLKSYDISNGLSQSSINTIIQDSAAYIWIATQDGLNKFNGNSFEVYRYSNENLSSLSSNFITDIFADEQNNLWVSSEEGVDLYNPQSDNFFRLSTYSSELEKLINGKVNSIAGDGLGNIWMGTEKNGLIIFNLYTGTVVHYHKKNSIIASNSIIHLSFNPEKKLFYITTNEGVYVANKKKQLKKILQAQDKQSFSKTIYLQGHWVICTNQGILVFNADNSTQGLLSRQSYQKLQKIGAINSFTIIKNKEYWISTVDQGVIIIDAQTDKWTKITEQNSELLSNEVFDIIQDKFGTIWIGSNRGINKINYNEQVFKHINKTDDGIGTGGVWGLNHLGPNLWISTEDGFNIGNKKSGFKSYVLKSQNPKDPDNKRAYNFFFTDNKAFIGAADGLYVVNLQNNLPVWSSKKKIPLPSYDYLRAYKIVAYNGGFAIGTNKGLYILNQNLEVVQSFFANEVCRSLLVKGDNLYCSIGSRGLKKIKADQNNYNLSIINISYKNIKKLQNIQVLDLYMNKAGDLFIGSFGNGLFVINEKKNTFKSINSNDGLPNDVIYKIIEDQNEHYWLSTNNGIVKYYPKKNLIQNFALDDGLLSNEFNSSSGFIDNSGYIYFGSINGVVYFKPRYLNEDHTPPQLNLSSVVINNVTRNGLISEYADLKNTEEGVYLKYYENNVNFDIECVHFLNPNRNRIEYKLEGFDEDFHTYQGSQKTVYYTNLDPGTYAFIIKGYSSNDTASDLEKVIHFTIVPPLWTNPNIYIVAILVIVGILIFIYYKKEDNARKYNMRMQYELDIATQEIKKQSQKIQRQRNEIEVEKLKVEDMLYNILPKATVEELKLEGKSKAQNYERASVMFTDIVGFTNLSLNYSPQELVDLLESMFSGFDKIADEFQLERIKTIGDSYMCVGGIPNKNIGTPFDMILCALRIKEFMVEFNKIHQLKEKWEVRIGINTGPVVAGVIGVKRLQYDIWGDTVNLASRMETSGEANRINISENTYKIIKDLFDCSYRGKIKAKNIGFVDMYFVEGIKQHLQDEEVPSSPNESFETIKNLKLYANIRYDDVEKHVLNVLQTQLPNDLHYHDLSHTIDVTSQIEKIAIREGVQGEDIYLLKTAALFHDIGFIRQYEHNESVGVEIARATLPKFDYNSQQIEIVADLIFATVIPHQPNTKLERIMCDADLDYLGRSDYEHIADKLRVELMEHGYIKTYRSWDELQVKFMEAHTYFTNSSKKLRQPLKEKHIKLVKNRLLKNEYPDQS